MHVFHDGAVFFLARLLRIVVLFNLAVQLRVWILRDGDMQDRR
jgi:hypothetical protein